MPQRVFSRSLKRISRIAVFIFARLACVDSGSTGNGYGPLTSGIVGTNEEYDPATDTWAFKEAMPTPRVRFAIGRSGAQEETLENYKLKAVCQPFKTSYKQTIEQAELSGKIVDGELDINTMRTLFSGRGVAL